MAICRLFITSAKKKIKKKPIDHKRYKNVSWRALISIAEN